jgi:uncharacterized protein
MLSEVIMQKWEEREAITLVNQGQKMFGIIHRPLYQTAVPAVLFCPGFAGNKCGKHRVFVTLSEELARRGILSLRFDYRGSGDSEGSFHDMTLESKVHDVLAALEFLSHDPQIDSSRIGILGRSLGGAISVLAAKRQGNVKSLALWAPVFSSDHWQDLWKLSKAEKLTSAQAEAIKNMPAKIPNMQFLQQFFSIRMQDELESLQHIPLLHIHGEKDSVVKVEHAEEYRKSRSASQNTRFVRLQNSDHDFSDFHEQQIAIQETYQWFQETL